MSDDGLGFLSKETRELLSEDELRLLRVAQSVITSNEIKAIVASVRVHPGEYRQDGFHDGPGMPFSEDLNAVARKVQSRIEESYGSVIPYTVIKFDYSADFSNPGSRSVVCHFSPIARAWDKKLFGDNESMQVAS